MKKWIVSILLGGILMPSISQAIDLKQSKFTQVVNTVEVIGAKDRSRHSAAVNDVFKMPDVLRTGPNSRAELVAPDNTITRVGANTIFSFDPGNRTIDLQQGSILFHSPTGKGGGTIRTGSATASVIGTTIIVTSTPGGGFKLLDLEGQAEIRFLNGLHQTLEPGQMTFILPGGGASPVVVFRLDGQVKGSLLVSGFNTPLASIGKIDAEIARQLFLLLNNEAQDTGLLVGNNATPDSVQVRQDINNEQAKSAFQGDGSIVGNDRVSTLPVNLPLDHNHVVTTPFAPPSGYDSFSPGSLAFVGIDGNPASGFVGNNIDIDTANIDLSSFAGKSDFDFMAAGDMRIWQSVNFTPAFGDGTGSSGGDQDLSLDSGQPDTIALFAGGQMLIAPGSCEQTVLEADTGTFGLIADSFDTLDTDTGTVDEQNTLGGVDIVNHIGDVDVLSMQDLYVYNSTFSAGGDIDIESQNGTLNFEDDAVVIDAGGSVSLSAGDNFYFYGGDGGYIEAEGGGVNIFAGNYLELDSASITADAGDLNVISYDDSIDIYGGCLKAYSTDVLCCGPSGGVVTIDAAGTVGIYDGAYIYGQEGVSITGGDGSDNGDVTIYDSRIRSNGYVDIESDNGGTLTVGTDPESDVTICAGSDVYLEANGGGDVDVTDTSITAGDNVNISSDPESLSCEEDSVSDGNVDLESSSATADFSVIVAAGNGSVTIRNTDLTAGGGDITEDSLETSAPNDGDISVGGEGISIDTSGSADVSSGGTINISGANITISCSTLYVKGDTTISDAPDISTDEGDVTISGGGGIVSISGGDLVLIKGTDISGNNLSISDSTISSADGGVSITDGGSITISTDGTAEICGGSIYLNNISISGGSTITSVDGDIDIINSGTASINTPDIFGTDITVDTISICGSDIAATTGDVDVSANGDVTINNSCISASSGVIFLSESDSETVGGSVSISSGGNIDLENNVDISSDGCAKLNADGYVYDYDGSIESDGGDVKICAGGYVDLEYTCVSADGSVNVNAGDYVEVYNNYLSMDDWNVDAGTYVDLGATGGVNISGGVITAEDGDVNIHSDESGDICITGGTSISASGDVNITSDGTVGISEDGSAAPDNIYLGCSSVSAGGSVYVTANGNVTIYDSPISATVDGGTDSSCDEVTISSGGELSITGTDSAGLSAGPFGYDIGADHKVCLSGDDGVSIDDALVETLDGCSYDKINVTSDGVICITDGSELGTSGKVKVESYDDGVNILDSKISAGGDVCISADDGKLTINAGNGFEAPEPLDDISPIVITYDIDSSSGKVDLSGDCVTIKDTAIYGECEVDVTGEDGDVKLEDVNITTGGGNIDVTAYDGDLTLESGCADYGVTVSSGACVTLEADGNVCISDSTITADTFGDGGNVNISAGNDLFIHNNSDTISGDKIKLTAGHDVSISCADIVANDGCVTITAGDEEAGTGSVAINPVSDLSSSAFVDDSDEYNASGGSYGFTGDGGITEYSGDINLSADDSVTISGAGLVADSGDVQITANDGDADIASGSILQAREGSVEITANGGAAEIDNSYIEAYDGVTITADGDVSLCNNYDCNGIYADNGDVDITSNDGAVNIYDTYISASGEADIEGACTLTLSGGTEIDANSVYMKSCFGDVDITCSTISAADGSFDVRANNGTVDIENSYVNAGSDNNLSISGSTMSASGGVTISAVGGDVEICGENVTVSDTTFNLGGNVSISGSCITANDGDVDISTSGTISIFPDGSECVYGNELSGVSIDICDTHITSNYGDVDIENGASISDAGGFDFGDGISANRSEITAGGISIRDSVISANAGDVNICAPGDVTICDSPISATSGVIALGESDTETVGGSVFISGGGQLTVDGNYAENCQGYDIEADNKVCLSGDEGVSIDGALIETLSDCSYDKISITSEGVICITDESELDTDGNVKVESCDDDVNILCSSISAGGDVCIAADGGMLTINAGNSFDESSVAEVDSFIYDINASGAVDLSGDCVKIKDTAIFGGEGVCVTGEDGSVKLEDADIVTCEGDVDIKAFDGDLTLESGCADYGVSITAGGSVTLKADYGVDISDTGITALDGCVEIKSEAITEGSDLDIEDSETLAEYGDDIEASGNVSIILDTGDVDIASGTEVDADAGGITIGASLGNVDIECSYLDAGSDHNVDVSSDSSISATGDVKIKAEGGDIQISAASGDVTINYSTADLGGNVSICGSDITSGICDGAGDVDISANGTLSISGDSVSVVGSDFSGSDITIKDSTITANGGDVNIIDCDNISITGGDVCLYDDQVSAGDITICGATITANGGSINIKSEGTVEIESEGTASIALEGSESTPSADDISISDSTLTASDCINVSATGNVDICDSQFYYGNGNDSSLVNQNISTDGTDANVYNSGGEGEINICAGGTINLQDSAFHTEGNLSISDSGISAFEGNVNITTGGDINVFGNCPSSLSMCGVEIVGGSISISHSTIEAESGNVTGGNVTIGGSGEVSFNGTALDPDSGYTALAGDVCVFDSSITANGGDVNIDSGGAVTLQGDNLQPYVVSGNNVTVDAQNGITVSGVSVNADPASGNICLNNTSGQTTINNGSSMQAFYINVNSPDGILLNSDGTPGKFAGNAMSLKASLGCTADDTTGAHSVTVCDTDLGQLATVNIQAHTVNLDSVNFSSGSSYNFTSFYHDYHINDGHVGGFVNFNNDTLDYNAITSSDPAGTAHPNNNGGIVLGGSGAGIHVN